MEKMNRAADVFVQNMMAGKIMETEDGEYVSVYDEALCIQEDLRKV